MGGNALLVRGGGGGGGCPDDNDDEKSPSAADYTHCLAAGNAGGEAATAILQSRFQLSTLRPVL